jgi:glycerol-3-phosphate acyltransferase PlsX
MTSTVGDRARPEIRVALDAMGGDRAPEMVIAGAAIAAAERPEARFLLVGDEARVRPLLEKHPALARVSEVLHTAEVVTNDAKPSVALRAGRQSSMRLAINAVEEGAAHAAVSAGNTGALMAMAKFVLKTAPGIDRPAIASVFPTPRGVSVMLDLGANVECDANNLVQFAIMGEVYARTVLNLERPSIGLLNVGSEDQKGHDELRAANAILRENKLNLDYRGFVEGDAIISGKVDVVVTDGFTGNVALKAVEGTARLYSQLLREAFTSSLLSKLGYALARPSMTVLRKRFDPRRYNGAILLGLNGIAVKSHGGTDAVGFAHAVGVALNMTSNRAVERIQDELQRLGGGLQPPRTAAG